MKLPKLREGPWKTEFEGRLQEHEVSIYSNPDDTIMAVVLDKEKEKIKGAVIELFKVFFCSGALEEFVQTLPKEAITLTKHSSEHTAKFLILNTDPSYAKMDGESFADEVDALLQKIHSSSDTVKDVARAYDLHLTELSKADESTKAEFFAQPITFFALSTSNQAQQLRQATIKIIKGDILFGLTKDSLPAREPLNLFEKTAVLDGKKEERKHIMHLIIEGALLSNIPVVIFDSNHSFDGLNVPTKNISGLHQFKVDFEPIGFPVKEFFPIEDVKIDLDMVSPIGLMQAFGVGEGKASQIIIDLMKKESFQNIKQMIERLNSIDVGGEITKSDIYKAARIIKLIDTIYPNFFDSKNNIQEISKNWVKAIGRAGIINIESLDERQTLILVHNVLKGILDYYKKMGETNEVNAMVFIADAEKFVGLQQKNAMGKEILQALNELKNFGVGYVFEAESANKLLGDASKNAETQIYIVEKNEASLKLPTRKQYRVRTRPGLSECMESLPETIPAKTKIKK